MSDSINDGGPAFPVTPTDRSGQCAPTEIGMTLRDYFAAKAMAALVSRPFNRAPSGNSNIKWAEVTENPVSGAKYIAIQSYHIADAMIAARGAKR